MVSMPVTQCWDTTDLSSKDRYDAWVELLNQTFGRWEATPIGTRDFSANAISSDIGNMRIVECICDPCEGERSASIVRNCEEDNLAIQLVLSGRESMRLGDQCATLMPGDLFIWDTSQPMTFQVEERLHKISVIFPLQRFRDWMSNRWQSSPRHIKSNSPTSTLLKSFMMSLTDVSRSDAPFSDGALIDAALALYSSPGSNELGSTSLKQSQLRFIKSFIRRRLNNPELSVEKIARANAMSVRNLHWLFEEEEQTVWRFVISERLKQCRKDLTNQAMTSRSITDIAFSWGFSDPAYFSKVFKAEYGQSPRYYRKMRLSH